MIAGRPKIKIILSASDRMLENLGIGLLILLWIFSVTSYILSPEIVPIHFNGSGDADGFGNKISILLLPLIPTFLYFLLGFVNKYPHIFNYPVEITEANAATQYANATRMMRVLKTVVVLVFLIINVSSFIATTNSTNKLGPWLIPLISLLLLAPTVYYIYRAFKVKQ